EQDVDGPIKHSLKSNSVVLHRNHVGVDLELVEVCSKPRHGGCSGNSGKSPFPQRQTYRSSQLWPKWYVVARKSLAKLSWSVGPQKGPDTAHENGDRERNLFAA